MVTTVLSAIIFMVKIPFQSYVAKIGGVIKNIKLAPSPSLFQNGEKHCHLPQKLQKFYDMFGRVMILISQSNQNSGSGRGDGRFTNDRYYSS